MNSGHPHGAIYMYVGDAIDWPGLIKLPVTMETMLGIAMKTEFARRGKKQR